MTIASERAATGSTTASPRGSALSWLAPTAWGAGLVLAGMGASAVVAATSNVGTRALGIVAAGVGIAALIWGSACLHRGRIVTPRIALGGVIAAFVAIGALLVATGGRASTIGAAIAVALLIAVGAIVASTRRHPSAPAERLPMIPLLVAAALVAVVATPALGAVQDAALVGDDGTVVVVDPHQGH